MREPGPKPLTEWINLPLAVLLMSKSDLEKCRRVVLLFLELKIARLGLKLGLCLRRVSPEHPASRSFKARPIAHRAQLLVIVAGDFSVCTDVSGAVVVADLA